MLLSFLESIKVGKSSRPDGIYPRILRQKTGDRTGLNEDQCSLTTGKFPEDWGVANVVPVKKETRGNPQHVRPASLVNCRDAIGEICLG